MRRLIRKLFRKRTIVLVVIIVFLCTIIYYLSASQIDLKNEYSFINVNEYNEIIVDKVKGEFTGESYTIEVSELEMNQYINSVLPKYLNENARILSSIKNDSFINISGFNKNAHVNIDYLFIRTSLFFDFDIRNTDESITWSISDLSVGNYKT